MKFIVYEDEKIFYDMIKKEIESLSIDMDFDCSIIHTMDPEELLELNKDDININIIDIIHNNGGEDGVSVARKLRDSSKEAHIIFYTSRIDKAYDVINSYIEPLSYIYKADPNVRDILRNAVEKVLDNSTKHYGEQVLKLKDDNGDKLFIKTSDIYFVATDEKRQKYLNVYLYKGHEKVKGILKDFIGLNDDLVQVSKSSVVNKTKIKLIKKTNSSRVKQIITTRPDNNEDGKCFMTDKYKKNLV